MQILENADVLTNAKRGDGEPVVVVVVVASDDDDDDDGIAS